MPAQGAHAYPIISRACIFMGMVFLLLSAFGNWRFGWSLSQDIVDRAWLAVIYAGSDVAAGLMVAAGATMMWRKGLLSKVGGLLALIPALILVGLSIMSTFGMMSGRIGMLVGHNRALQVDQGRVDWLRGQSISRENPKGERRRFLLEERIATKAIREQASQVTDPQAVALTNAASLVGVKLTVEQTQVGLTLITSTMPMTIKFVLIWLGFLLYGSRVQNIEFSENTHGGSKGSGNSGSGGSEKLSPVKLSEKVRPLRPEPPKPMSAVPISADARKGEKLTYAQFCHVIEQDMVHGEPASSTRALVAATGWSQSSVSKQLRKVKDRRNMRPQKRLNGGGGYHAPASG